MAKRKPSRELPRKGPARAADSDPRLGVRFFPTHPGVTKEIAEWARREGVRVRAIVPVYWEGI